MYGIRLEHSIPSRFVTVKELRGLTWERQQRIAIAWNKARAILNRRYLGLMGFYVSTFYHGGE